MVNAMPKPTERMFCSLTLGALAQFLLPVVAAAQSGWARPSHGMPGHADLRPGTESAVTVSLEQPILPQAADAWIVEPASSPQFGACDAGLCGGCDGCAGPLATRLGWGIWGSADYLLWWEKGSELPPLVTTSTLTPNRENAGVLGFPRTRVVFGGENVDDNTLSGMRVTLGTWLDAAHTAGLGVRYFTMGEREVGFAGTYLEYPILARPFFDVITDRENALLLTYPDDLAGTAEARLTGNTWGWEGYLRWFRHQGCNYRLELIAGYRYLEMDEELLLRDRFEFVDPQDVNFGRVETDEDVFGTSNVFHGGDLGIAGQSQRGRWSLDFLAKVGLGNMHQEVTIAGSHTVQVPGAGSTTAPGGLLAQQTNIGRYNDNQFTWLPEVDVNVGFAITPNLDVTCGYTFLYVSRVMQPGDAVDRQVNLTQRVGELIGPARPAFAFRDSDYWLQGLTFGLQGRF
jgi:hypothetical protein